MDSDEEEPKPKIKRTVQSTADEGEYPDNVADEEVAITNIVSNSFFLKFVGVKERQDDQGLA